MARVIWALFQIATWQLTFYSALRYTHMDDELPCEHSWQAKANDMFFLIESIFAITGFITHAS